MGKTPAKTSFGSSISKSSSNTFGTSNKTSKAPTSKVSSKTPFLGSSASSSGHPGLPKKTYESASFAPKRGKYSYGVIWIPTKNRNKKKDSAYSSINYDKEKRDRAPSMYNFMSGDSSELHKKKEEESSLVLPERAKGPYAGAIAIAEVIPEKEEKLKKRDISDSKEAAGDANSEDESYLENKDSLASSPDEKKASSADKVDSVFVNPCKVPPRSTASTQEEEDCVIKCLYYTLQCCDCVIM